MKRPAQFPRADIEGVNISRRSGQRLRQPTAHDEKVFVNDPGAGRTTDCFGGIAPQPLAKIDTPVFSEPRNRLTGPRVESVQKTLDGDEQPAIAARGPIHHRPVRSASRDPRVEAPPQLSRSGIESHHFVRRRNAIHYAVDHDGLRLRIARAIRGVIGPGDLKPRDIRNVDLLQTGISNVRRPSAVSRPIAGRLAERGRAA